MSARQIRRIFVRELACQVKVGIHDYEKTGSRLVYIDLEAVMEDKPHDDRIENTVCYDELAEIARKIAGGERMNLMETLAERIADACLAQMPIRQILVRVHKAGVMKDAKQAGVEIIRDRPSE